MGLYIMHFGKEIICDYKLDEYVEHFMMVDSERAVYLLYGAKQLVLLNLRTQKEEKRVDWVKFKNSNYIDMFKFN